MYEISEAVVEVVVVVVISLGVSDDLKRKGKWNNLMYRRKIITGDTERLRGNLTFKLEVLELFWVRNVHLTEHNIFKIS